MATHPETSPECWTAVDDYLAEKLLQPDAALNAAQAAADAAGLPRMAVSPLQGKLLQLLARASGARRILEIGTLAGYSTIWLARALPPGGEVVTLEFELRHTEVAIANLEHAGLADRVRVITGPALDSLQRLADEGTAPFDMVFVDADKQSNTAYVDWALRLARPGALLIVDNVVRHGRVVDAGADDPSTVGTRAMFDFLSACERISATAIQMTGSKGLDGMLIGVIS